MFDDKGYTITSTYDRAVRSLELVEDYLGLNIKVHGEQDLLYKGQIFLFNHFARFETLIPPYILYRQAKAYARSVADHSLFTASKALGKFLSEVGAVPNDMPGLLPYLAAEILRGRKVVIFPEGAIIKDRRVLDAQGQLGIFSPTHQVFRKHHRGAAVLALILDIFKQRIRDLWASGDIPNLMQWVETLEFDSPEQLLEQARKPTVMVPATITFYPIRVTDTFLSRGAEYFARKNRWPPRLLEELRVEGNIVFRDTDMDIRLGDPIVPRKQWSWWELTLIRRYFLGIEELEHFLSQKEVADSWHEQLLMRLVTRESNRIRDEYMNAIYAGITVNLGHLASSLIYKLLDRGDKQLSLDALHQTLYLALKALQNKPGVYLHRSLLWPDRYEGLDLDGSEELSRFMQEGEQAGLLEKTDSGYLFLDKLRAEYGFHEIRVENPLQVYANEVAPIKAVAEALDEALAKVAEGVKPRELADLLFDDELRAHARNRAHYNKKRYREINARETASLEGEPYLLRHRQGARVGVLLVHGLLASPAELRGFGEKAHAEGYDVLGVRLAGHGTSPWDLHERDWEDWLASVRRGYRILALLVDEVVIVGFSTGAALSLLLAAEKPDKLAGIASVAAPFALQNKHVSFAPLLHRAQRVVDRISPLGEDSLFRPNAPEFPDINYQSIPIAALSELLELISRLKHRLAEVEAPVVLIQGDEDSIVKPESATHIHDALTNSARKELHWIPGGPHWLILGNVGETHALLLAALRNMAGSPLPAPEHDSEQEKSLS